MKKTSEGYKTCPGFLEQQMAVMPEFKNELMPRYYINEYEPLLDSSDMSPGNWLVIAQDIAQNYDKYDGFIVLHGTDTMAYTASALPFMLQGLQKPVILTGGQIPLCEIRNDSRDNLITAMLIAANYNIPEVCLFFGSKLIRGNRSVKVDANSFEAFDSPNFPLLASCGIGIDINWNLVLPCPVHNLGINVNVLNKSAVAALRLFPGISEDVLRNILKPPIEGLVLETYGVGNGPANNPVLLNVLRSAAERGVVIVNCTQCYRGRVRMGAYATGTALGRAGVISGLDMTAEAALTKMFYLLSQNLPLEAVKAKMQENMKGELTELL